MAIESPRNSTLAGCDAAAMAGATALYPIVLDAIDGSKVSVGPPFFDKTFVPLMAPALLLTAAAPFMAWAVSATAGSAA